jgi:hypothetical protein
MFFQFRKGSITGRLFQKHIENFPLVNSNGLPPEHTAIVEDRITDPPKRKQKNKKIRQQKQ